MDAGTVRIEVGTGAYSFESVANAGTVPVIHGPQGGYHIWGALRAHGLDPSGIRVVYVLELSGDPPVPIYASAPYIIDLAHTPNGDEFAGLVGYVDDPARVLGRPVTMKMTVTDTLGRTASDAKEVIPYATW